MRWSIGLKTIPLSDTWKYKVVNYTEDSQAVARIWLNDDGTINEERTYSSEYLSPPPLPNPPPLPPPYPPHPAMAPPPQQYGVYGNPPTSNQIQELTQVLQNFLASNARSNEDYDEEEDNEDMYYEFTASRVSGDGNAMFPDKLIITDDGVIYRKGRIIGYKEIKIRHSAIGSVSLDKHLLFADIIIETNGGQKIIARGFSRSDANIIRDLLD
ncbi:MAG: PH domain-containing protein [Muribaculaceae bacterium]|nr:PH domain-containing protein [Muribaculaceae bacterium]MDY6411676.1 PH domain-containing protein [Bacteroidales bacterium]